MSDRERMIDPKEYAAAMRKEAVRNENGIIQVFPELWEQIASLIERAIIPPCKVGDTVYMIFNNEIRELTVISLSYMISSSIKHFNLHTTNYRGAMLSYEIKDFGKTVFLSREDAERALQEVQNAE